MKELINVAERLYKQLDDLREKLAPNLNSDDNQILLRAECFMLNVIKRKDNIVDLSEVWHDINIVPSNNKGIIYLTKKGKIGVIKAIKSDKWDWYVADKYSIIKWAYIDDLLPKGGGK